MTVQLRTASAEQTKEMAAVVAEHVRPGDLLLLVGDLGAGKTTFAQGFARALGVEEAVTSPTFTLARTYPGRLSMHHVDVYRLERMSEVGDLALGELIDSNGVTLIEWGDAIAPVLGSDYLEVRMVFGAGDDDRRLELTAYGQRWSARSRAVAEAAARWAPPVTPAPADPGPR